MRNQSASALPSARAIAPAAIPDSSACELLTYEQLAPHLGLKRTAIEGLVSARKIPVIRINRRVVRFRLKDVMAALDKLTVKEVG